MICSRLILNPICGRIQWFSPLIPKRTLWYWILLPFWCSKDFLQKGYDVILSNSQQWNVDIKENTWQNVYNYDLYSSLSLLMDSISTSQLKNKTFTGHLLGGELMASTHLIDTSDLFSSLYPALSAVAEKLWSEESTAVSKVENLQARHSTFRYYLMERGIYSVPITTKNIRDPPDCPGSYFSQ